MNYQNIKFIIEDGLSTLKKTGVGHYTIGLEERFKDLEIPFYHINKSYIEKLKPVKLRRVFYTIWLNTIFPITLFFKKGLKIVILTNTNTPFVKLPGIKYVPIIHDTRPFKIPDMSASKFINSYEKRKVTKAVERGHHFIVVSNTVKDEVIERFGVDPDKIEVIYNTISPHFYNCCDDTSILDKYNIQKSRYILTVSTRQKWKNMPMIIDAFKNYSKNNPDLKLVLVGKSGNDGYYENNPNIIFTGYVNDEELPVLYKYSALYISASSDEGFGIPIIEAQYSGVPVICSDIPIYREVASEQSALFFNINPIDIENCIKNVLENKNIAENLISKGKENINRFTENNLSKILNSIIEKIGVKS